MKSYTDISQSKKLAEILPIESADMYYTPFPLDGDGYYDTPQVGAFSKNEESIYLPCWSLAALLDVLPYYEINNWGDSMQFDVGNNALAPEGDETLLDLVVDMICDLHEQKLL